jgi:hypothetical protein
LNFTLKRYPILAGLPARTSFLMPLLGLATSCSPPSHTAAHTAQDKTAEPCRSPAQATRPTWAEPVPPPAPEVGEAWLTLDLPLAAIQREVERYVPRTLAAEEDRPIGAPGRVSYRVTRGQPKLRASGGQLVATLPVQIDLSLCKPFGSLCIGYGSCTPAYEVKASWDLTLSAQHELPDVRLTQKVTKRCSIGLDVTDHVTGVVKEQLRGVEAQLEGRIPPLAPWVDRAIVELTRPSMLAVGQCIAFAPTEVLLAGPVTNSERVTFGVGLSGAMTEAACDAPPHPGRGLPVRRPEHSADPPRLQLRQHFPAEAVRTALAGATARASTSSLRLTLREHILTRSGVLLELELGGSACGTVWVEVQLGVDGEHVSIDAAHVHEGDHLPVRAAEIEASLVGPLDLPSRAPRWVSDLAIEERTDILGTLLGEKTELDLQVKAPKVLVAQVVTATDGIWVLTDIASRLGLKAQAHSTP